MLLQRGRARRERALTAKRLDRGVYRRHRCGIARSRWLPGHVWLQVLLSTLLLECVEPSRAGFSSVKRLVAVAKPRFGSANFLFFSVGGVSDVFQDGINKHNEGEEGIIIGTQKFPGLGWEIALI